MISLIILDNSYYLMLNHTDFGYQTSCSMQIVSQMVVALVLDQDLTHHSLSCFK